RVRTAVDTPGQHLGRDEIGCVLGASGDLLRPIHHGYVATDGPCARDLVHKLSGASCEAASLLGKKGLCRGGCGALRLWSRTNLPRVAAEQCLASAPLPTG